jgi:selenium metabolism protein YedF
MSQTMVVVTAEGLGRGDEDLGRRLMTKFLGQLATLGDKPHVVAFYNAGVKLLVRGSPGLDALHALDRDGVELVACGTCVEHFGIREQLGIGRVSDMREIVAGMQASDKVITA